MERIGIFGDVELSRIVYGMWRLGDDQDTSIAHIRSKIDACLDQGVTTMDHADIYGGYMVEELFGDALRGSGLRQRIEIITKCGIVYPAGRHRAAKVKHYDTSAGHITASVDESLRLMGTDYIDLLLVHRPDPFMDHVETGAALDALVKAGKVRSVGVSNFRPWDQSLLQSAMGTRLATNQIELSLMATEPFTNGDIAHLQQMATPAMAWSPLGGGRLMTESNGVLAEKLDRLGAESGIDRAAVAIAWLLAHPARILPVLGTNSIDRIRRFSEALEVRIDRQTWFELYAAARGNDVP
ncbi:aldo/keto reductase [Ensifer sp. 4252]|uniref:aldo/keto reductase n=1 Tax=Ensifer sp. 4252 TaxID=3373915 RepID=UPI003D216432